MTSTSWKRWALLAIVAIQVTAVFLAARGSFFTWDDYPNLLHALDEGLTLDYLTRGTFTVEHLAPGHRLGYLLLARLAPMNFAVALALLLACLGLATVLLHGILERLSGGAWWTLLPTALYGTSVATLAAAAWWAAGLHSFPATVLSLAAILVWLRHRDTGSRSALVAAAAATLLGSLFYVKAILVPLYLLALRLVVLEPRPGWRAAARTVWAERGAWALLGLPAVLLVCAHAALGYGGAVELPAPDVVQAYLAAAWVRGVVPALANVRVTAEATRVHEVGIVAAQAAFWMLVYASARRNPAAWRGWALLGVAFVANMAVHGLYRLAEWGTLLVYEWRYYTELAYLLPIAATIAFAPHAAREPPVDAPADPPPPRAARLAAAVMAVHLALFGLAAAQHAGQWPGYAARPWMLRVMSEVADLPADAALLDTPVPEAVVPAFMVDFRPASQLFRTFAPALRFDARAGRLFALTPEGSLRRVQAVRLLDVAEPLSQLSVTLDAAEHLSDHPFCVRTAGAPGSLTYRGSFPLTGEHLAFQSEVATEPRQTLQVAVDEAPPLPFIPSQGDGATLIDLGAGALGTLRVDLPGLTTTCFTTLEVFALTWEGP